jgi:hypothetical protein
MTAELAELAAALIAAQAEFEPVPKTAENPFFHSHYAPMDALVAMAGPILSKHGLAVVQIPTTDTDGQGTPALYTALIHKSGQMISATMLTLPVKMDPQGQGAAISYARRFAYSAILGLVTDDDTDGEAAQGRGTGGKARRGVRTTGPSNASDGGGLPPGASGSSHEDKAAAGLMTDGASPPVRYAPQSVIRQVQQFIREQGVPDDHDARCNYIGTCIGRPVDSSAHITTAEAKKVLGIA